MASDKTPRFDDYADRYCEIIDAEIGISGESTTFFAQLKARLTAMELRDERIEEVLDFGCGVGLSSRALASAIPQARIVGCDPSRASVERARAMTGHQDSPSFVHFDGERLRFDDMRFDAAFTSCVFHHIEQREHARWASELRRVLKPGGALLIFEHNPYNPLTVRAVRRIPFDEGVILLKPRYTLGLLRDAGFEVSRTRYYFFFPRMLGRLRRFERVMRWIPFGAQYYVRARRPPAPPAGVQAHDGASAGS